jgi:hypothetical protein
VPVGLPRRVRHGTIVTDTGRSRVDGRRTDHRDGVVAVRIPLDSQSDYEPTGCDALVSTRRPAGRRFDGQVAAEAEVEALERWRQAVHVQ